MIYKTFVQLLRAGLTWQVVIMAPVVALGMVISLGSRVEWPAVFDTVVAWKDNIAAIFT